MPAQTVEEKAPSESMTTDKQGTEATPKPEHDKTPKGKTQAEDKATSEKETAKPESKNMGTETLEASNATIEKATSGKDKLIPNADQRAGPTTDVESAPHSGALKSGEEVVTGGNECEAKVKTGAGDAMDIKRPTTKESKTAELPPEAKNRDGSTEVEKSGNGDEGIADTAAKPEEAQIPSSSVKSASPAKTETPSKTAPTEMQDEEKSANKPKRSTVTFGPVEEAVIEEEDEEYRPNEDEENQDDDDGEDGEIAEGDEPLLDLKSLPPSFTTSLLENGAINRPLHGLASKGKTDELRALLAKGGEMEGKVDDRDLYQYTALHVAAENDRLEACKLLLEHGADIEASTKMHESKPIHYAAIEGHDEVISFLLEKDANINALTDDNRTALYLAAMRGHDHCVKLLLEKGANRDLADRDGKKPADVADKQAVVDLLISPPAKKARIA